MITNRFAAIVAILAIVAMLLPAYASAASDATQTIQVNGASEHEDQYDKVVNVASDTSATNQASWNPTYQGLWFGGSTEESKFQLNQVTTADSRLITSSYYKFSTTQIMTGVGEFMVRSPLFVDGNMTGLELLIYKTGASNSDAFTVANSVDHYAFGHNSTETLIYSLRMDPTVHSITNPSRYYTVDSRTYVLLDVPIVPETYYNFIWVASYSADGRMTVFFSPNDIVSDSIVQGSLYTYIQTDPINHQTTANHLNLELGISFDMRVGLANNLFAKSMFMATGSVIDFYTYYPGAGNLNGYQSLTIPFFTDTGNATFGIEVSKYLRPNEVFWTVASRGYRNYIVASSTTELNAAISGPNVLYNGAMHDSGDLFKVRITSTTDQNVEWIFLNQGANDDVSYFQGGYDIPTLTGIETYKIGYSMMSSYAVSSNMIGPPNTIYQEAQHVTTGIVWQPHTIFGILAFGLYTTASAVFTDGWSHGPITGIVSTLVAAPIAGLAAALWIQDQAVGLISDAATAIANGFYATFKNAIDAVWNTLVGIGKFLWSIGEGLFNAIQVLWNGLIEYGSIALGFVIIFIALIIFFWVIKEVTKIWNSFLMLAKGNAEAAGANFQGVVRDVESAGSHWNRYGTKARKGIMKRFRGK